jgi:hypothetical protein
MKIFSHFSSGALRSLRSWKWILVVWIAGLILVALPGLTLRSELNGIFSKSMITEKLTDRTFVDALANTGTGLQMILSSLTAGFLLVILFGVLINIFFNGGLFTVLRKIEGKRNSAVFFAGASSNFWSFMVIWLLVFLMISVFAFLIIGLPIIIRTGSGSGGSSVLKITSLVMILILPVFLLVADYARAWQSSNDKKDAIKAIGHGFKNTFRHFFSSWIAMLVMIIIQLVYVFIVFRIAGNIKPVSGGGIFLLFILIQVLFIIKLFLRSWRYGIVTSMFEKP